VRLDSGDYRLILHRAGVSEIVTPYGDPGFPTWSPLDVGNYGLARYMPTSHVPGEDAPVDAVFIDALLPTSQGDARTVPRAVAVYEVTLGVLWRHSANSVGRRYLAVSYVAVVDNYDYVFTWRFERDGSLEFEVNLSGYVNYYSDSTTESEGGLVSHRTYLGNALYAPTHQHFLSIRLDFDYGTASETVLEVDTLPVSSEARQGTVFGSTMSVLESERGAIRRVSPMTSRRWRVVDGTRPVPTQATPGYVLYPAPTVSPLFTADSAIAAIAGFALYDFWVTPFAPREQRAAGEYPNLSQRLGGLSEWTKADRAVAGVDNVVWYTMGMTHIVRREEWPRMISARNSFQLRPVGFLGQ